MDGVPVYTAGGTIVVASIVKQSTAANCTVLQCGANEKAFGVAQAGSNVPPIPDVATDPHNAATVGQQLHVFTAGMYALLRAGTAGVTAGDKVKSDSAGDGVPTAETAGLKENYVGYALETASDGELFKLLVMPGVVTTPA